MPHSTPSRHILLLAASSPIYHIRYWHIWANNPITHRDELELLARNGDCRHMVTRKSRYLKHSPLTKKGYGRILEPTLRSCGSRSVFKCTRLVLRCGATHFSVLPLYGLLCTYIVTSYSKQIASYIFYCCAFPNLAQSLLTRCNKAVARKCCDSGDVPKDPFQLYPPFSPHILGSLSSLLSAVL